MPQSRGVFIPRSSGMTKENMSNCQEIKLGSDLVTNRNGIDRSRIESHVSRIADKEQLIVVTSGAVAAGRALYRQMTGDVLDETIDNQKYLAGLGCTAVFHAFEEAFRGYGRLVASYPITHNDLDNNQQLVEATHANLSRRTVVIFNEADAYSQTELMKLKTGGDNDGLAAHVAITMGVKSLTIITEKGGIVDDNRKLIERVDRHNEDEVEKMLEVRGITKGNGRGGIQTKFAACLEAARHGINASITDEHYQKTTQFMLG